MSKTSKKQTLLTSQPKKRKPAKNTNKLKPTNTQINGAKASEKKPGAPQKKTRSKKVGFTLLASCLLVLFIFPKPTLLSYQKLGMLSESIYWPGFFGYGSRLVDSHFHPQVDSDRKTLYLCSDKANPKSCQKYTIVADKGVVSALKAYFNH
ncbi:hypothetical protein J8L70_07465 [Pseudoalteromonas sp. MMG010]|uniref:hypothetical protein n=1 Tax=Pseudoalteromonas sp. MMG010 TaxID=2822685 RepID=UPI001B39D77B|nr:hypothetical protein [Pseudoalteromonas sp. MMG010]MBQ4833074.1 hypothetical protein [Pseudoalteromonas sp. MMG010]